MGGYKLGLAQAVDSAAEHEVGAHEPGEGEKARHGFLGLMGETQQHGSDAGDGELDAHDILAASEEMLDFQGLLDPAEEQLDAPAPLVESGDLVGRRVEIVAEDAQDFAGFDAHPDFAQRIGEGIAPACGETLREEPDPVAEDAAPLGNGVFNHIRQLRIGLQPRDDAASGGIELRPSAIIIIAEIEHIGRHRVDRHLLRRRDVVEPRAAQRGVERTIGVGIMDDMQLRAAGVGRKAGPAGAERAQPETGRIDEMHALAHRLAIAGQRLGDEAAENSGEHVRRAKAVGVRQGRARRFARADDVAQAFGPGQLAIEQRQKLGSRRQLAHARVGPVLFNKPVESAPRNMLRDGVEYAVLMPHGVASFSCPNPSPNDSN